MYQPLNQRKENVMVSGVSSFSSSTAASLAEMRQKMFKSVDTNSDGSIDKTEMSALFQQNTSSIVDSLFTGLDANQDDLISMIESDASLAKLGQSIKNSGDGMAGVSGMPPPDKVFDAADTDGDGSVTKEELASVIGEGGADELFSKIDTDGDSLISRAEDETFRESMAGASGTQAPPPPPDKVFDTADTNQDGIVSKEELAAVMGSGNIDKLFSKIDTDGDNFISRSEDETFRKNMTEEMQNNTSSKSDLNNINDFVQDWQSKMFEALLNGLNAATSSSQKSTSLYA
ncbi:MAG: EF-hand domain-containing protein [Syntrophus sp. (in: bacteria)]